MDTSTKARTLEELTGIAHWVGWHSDKTPVDPQTLKHAKSNDADTWRSYECALRAYQQAKVCIAGFHDEKTQKWYDCKRPVVGVGFMLTQAIGLLFIDVDDCFLKENGDYIRDENGNRILLPDVKALLAKANSYAEESPNRGIHVLGYGVIPKNSVAEALGAKRRDSETGQEYHIEMYRDRRYTTITRKHVEGTPETLNDFDPTFLETLFNALQGHKPKESKPNDSK